jgi:hypothetical protein
MSIAWGFLFNFGHNLPALKMLGVTQELLPKKQKRAKNSFFLTCKMAAKKMKF